jgi:rhamnose utilization protein RhaD (predicted bifunctional aldolase and dehydrogenase)
LFEDAVVHTHPVDVNAILCTRESHVLVARVFGDAAVDLGGPPIVLPYVTPGIARRRVVCGVDFALSRRTAASRASRCSRTTA